MATKPKKIIFFLLAWVVVIVIVLFYSMSLRDLERNEINNDDIMYAT